VAVAIVSGPDRPSAALRAAKAAARRTLQTLGLYAAWKLTTQGPLKTDGWLRSFREGRPVDAAGKPIPWLTYPAIEFLAARTRPEWRVFEYGAGASTRWWAARVADVTSVEHDPAWHARVAADLPANVTLLHVPLEPRGPYAATAARWPHAFDVVVIDGRDRVRCVDAALEALKPSGVIVFDNTDREDYRPGLERLAAARFRKLEFIGLIPVFHQKSETAILYRDGNCLGL
jgi:hypothetical protein